MPLSLQLFVITRIQIDEIIDETMLQLIYNLKMSRV